jgi:hypothetical protein
MILQTFMHHLKEWLSARKERLALINQSVCLRAIADTIANEMGGGLADW